MSREYGLPGNPRAVRVPPAQSQHRTIKSQRSMPSVVSRERPAVHRERVPEAPTQSLRQRPTYQCPQLAHSSTGSTSSASSYSGQSWSSDAPSSRTSISTLLDDVPASDPAKTHKTGWQNQSIDSSMVWTKVTQVANMVSQEVNKVWSTTNTSSTTDRDDDGHLLHVMRSYHLSKAQHPSQLPDWLFSERERGQAEPRNPRLATRTSGPPPTPVRQGPSSRQLEAPLPGTRSVSDRLRAKRAPYQ